MTLFIHIKTTTDRNSSHDVYYQGQHSSGMQAGDQYAPQNASGSHRQQQQPYEQSDPYNAYGTPTTQQGTYNYGQQQNNGMYGQGQQPQYPRNKGLLVRVEDGGSHWTSKHWSEEGRTPDRPTTQESRRQEEEELRRMEEELREFRRQRRGNVQPGLGTGNNSARGGGAHENQDHHLPPLPNVNNGGLSSRSDSRPSSDASSRSRRDDRDRDDAPYNNGHSNNSESDKAPSRRQAQARQAHSWNDDTSVNQLQQQQSSSSSSGVATSMERGNARRRESTQAARDWDFSTEVNYDSLYTRANDSKHDANNSSEQENTKMALGRPRRLAPETDAAQANSAPGGHSNRRQSEAHNNIGSKQPTNQGRHSAASYQNQNSYDQRPTGGSAGTRGNGGEAVRNNAYDDRPVGNSASSRTREAGASGGNAGKPGLGEVGITDRLSLLRSAKGSRTRPMSSAGGAPYAGDDQDQYADYGHSVDADAGMARGRPSESSRHDAPMHNTGAHSYGRTPESVKQEKEKRCPACGRGFAADMFDKVVARRIQQFGW